MNNRYAWLLAHNRRKISRYDNVKVIAAIIDEIAFYSATVGTKQQQEEFIALLRDLVARGRAAGIPVIAATQRPSVDIIPTSLRDIFGYRAAFRCTTPNSSNIILGHGWAEAGFSATDISPTNQGVAYLIAEGGVPDLMKAAYLNDEQIGNLVDYATWIRRTGTTPASAPVRLAPALVA
jgi:S-DNA-T family DNA segregation ATPase FtsK/SpoIIIE